MRPAWVDAAWTDAVAVTRVWVTWSPAEPWRPGEHAGVLVRGQLGARFTDVACLRPPRDCAPCELAPVCLVPGWFDPNVLGGHQPRPWALAVRAGPVVDAAHPLRARVTFAGPLPSAEAVEAALRRPIAFGASAIPHALTSLRVEQADLLAGDPWPAPTTLAACAPWPDAPPAGATLSTRSRTQVDAKRPMDRPDDLLGALRKRCHDVARTAGVRTGRWPDAPPPTWSAFLPERAGRYSARQDAHLNLSGWRGEVSYGPEVAGFVDLLAAAAVLQVGRNTTSGMGEIALTWR